MSPIFDEEPIIVYVLQGETKRYVGITNDLARRLKEHSNGSHSGRLIGSRFRVLHTEEYPNYALARKREKFLKSGRGREWLSKTFS
jgi:putative endonuclease